MGKKYQDVYALIAEDAAARHYFDALPDYVRDQIASRADSVNSFESLKDYAQNLTRGDN